MDSTVSFAKPVARLCGVSLIALALLAGCEREPILQGERFGTRVPLAQSLQSEEGLDATAEAADVAVVPFAHPTAQSLTNWPLRGANAANAIPALGFSQSASLLWSTDIGQGNGRRTRLTADPIFTNGAIITLDSDAGLQATSPEGSVIWRTDLTPASERDGGVSGGGIGAAGDQIFASTGYGELLAIDASSGAISWRQRLGASLGAPTIAGGVVYVTGRDDQAYAVDATTGRVRWEIPATGAATVLSGSPSPALTSRLVVFPFGSGELTGVLRQSGVRVWSGAIAGERIGVAYNYINDITSDPVVAGGRLYVGNLSGRVVSIDAGSGERLWTATEGAYSGLIVAGNSVFFVSDRNALIRLNQTTGEMIWETELPLYEARRERRRKAVFTYYGPILAGGHLILATGDGEILRFDPETGAALDGRLALRSGAASQPIVVNDTLYVVSADGRLHAYR